MHHLIWLVLVAAAIILLWLFPPSLAIAIPVLVVIFLICLAVTWAVIRAARKSPQAGVEDLIGVSARITSVKELTYGIEYRVKIEGELWNARSSDRLAAGELVTVEKVNGLLLQVKRAKTESPPG